MPGQLFFFRGDCILKKINLDEIMVMEATGNYVKLNAAGTPASAVLEKVTAGAVG